MSCHLSVLHEVRGSLLYITSHDGSNSDDITVCGMFHLIVDHYTANILDVCLTATHNNEIYNEA